LEGGAQPRAAAVDEAMAHVAILGALWALLAWAPLLLPKLGWHAYYALFGALGAWLALALGLARWRWLAPVLIGCLALARAGLATTPTSDWGTEWFQRRAAAFTEDAHAALSRLRPALPPHSRVFFAGVPGSIGLVPGGEESPPLRVWYRDRTLRAASLERYRPRPAGDTSGQDVFFRFDPEVGWREIVKGEEDVAAARARAPRWRADHEQLAIALARGRDWNGTCAEYLKLAGAYPEDPAYAYYTGLALAVLGDSVRSGEWIRRAAALPTADEEIRAAARGLGPVPGGRNGSTAPAAAGRAPRSSPATDRRGAPHAPIAPPGRRR
jgi:hypothetical protein